MMYLKWTAPGRVPSYQRGDPLPEPGVWTPTVADPVICQRGWHACRWEDAAYHLSAELWVCELAGKIVEGPDKVAGESLRLVRRVPITDAQWRHFAADCAESVLHLFERVRPGDDRPRLAIQAARDFADGKITKKALAAAWAATWAAEAAAEDAAGAAARAATGAAAWAAAEDAAGAAARDAAGAAAGDAAWAAAGDAAGAAAWAAARDAAWAAAGAAARDAAWAAAGAAQSDLLLTRLGLDPTDFAHRTEEA